MDASLSALAGLALVNGKQSWAANFSCRCGAMERGQQDRNDQLSRIDNKSTRGKFFEQLAWASSTFAAQVEVIEKYCTCPERGQAEKKEDA